MGVARLLAILGVGTVAALRHTGVVTGRGFAAPPPLGGRGGPWGAGGHGASSDVYRGQTDVYGSQSDVYGGQNAVYSNGYGSQSDLYSNGYKSQSDVYSNSYGGPNSVYGLTASDEYRGKSDVHSNSYGIQSDVYGGHSAAYGGQRDVYGEQNEVNSGQSEAYGAYSDGYGSDRGGSWADIQQPWQATQPYSRASSPPRDRLVQEPGPHREAGLYQTAFGGAAGEAEVVRRLERLYRRLRRRQRPRQTGDVAPYGRWGARGGVRFPTEGEDSTPSGRPGLSLGESFVTRHRGDMLSTEEWLQYRGERGDSVRYPVSANKREHDIITVDNLHSWVEPALPGPDTFTVNVESALNFAGGR